MAATALGAPHAAVVVGADASAATVDPAGSTLRVPVRDSAGVEVGTLSVGDTAGRDWSDRERSLLAGVAEAVGADLLGARVAAAIEQAATAIAVYDGVAHAMAHANPAYRDLLGDTDLTVIAERVLRTGQPTAGLEVSAGDRVFSVSCSAAGADALLVAVDVTATVLVRRETDRARGRLTVLDHATVAVGSDLDIRRALTALADAVVPGLADGCAVYSPAATGMERLAVATNPRFGRATPTVAARLTDDDAVTRAARAGVTVTAGPISGLLGDDGWEHTAAVHTVVGVPVLAGDTLLAVLAFAAGRGRADYDQEDIALMGRIAARTRVALTRDMAHWHNQTVATALQRGMLTVPPEIEGLQLAVRYQPASAVMEVGGDWYDAFPLPGGGLAVAIGDVVGHDIAATAAMGQLRSMLQALASQPGAEPARILGDLDRLTTDLGITTFATALYGRLDPGPGGLVLTWSNAGHPPPLLLPPGGEPVLLDDGSGTALGAVADTGRSTHVTALSRGATLLLYTDGLIERRGEPIDAGLDRIVELAGTLAPLPLEDLCSGLVSIAADTDDVALLAVRVATG